MLHSIKIYNKQLITTRTVTQSLYISKIGSETHKSIRNKINISNNVYTTTISDRNSDGESH